MGFDYRGTVCRGIQDQVNPCASTLWSFTFFTRVGMDRVDLWSGMGWSGMDRGFGWDLRNHLQPHLLFQVVCQVFQNYLA